METVSEQSVNHDERRQAAKGAGDEMTAAGEGRGKGREEGREEDRWIRQIGREGQARRTV